MVASAARPDNPASGRKHFHIFGNGISFSVSPTIHNAAFQHDGLPHDYDIRESVSVDEIAPLIQAETFGGGSVTMPHKLHIHKYCDRVTETAQLIGAINTLVVGANGKRRMITGDNTDWSGLHSLIEEYKQRTKHNLISGLVIGAGGASRAALYAMSRAGVQTIYLVNRTLSTAESARNSFKDSFSITVISSLDKLPEKPEIVIGTVPADKTNEEQFDGLFGARGLCIDMSYKPRQTPLLTMAQKHTNWETVTGLEVLLAQAFEQYRLWINKEPPKEAMRNAVLKREAGL